MSEIPTPRTDVLAKQFGLVLHPAVMAYNSLARELERENAKLRALLVRAADYVPQPNTMHPKAPLHYAIKDALKA